MIEVTRLGMLCGCLYAAFPFMAGAALRAAPDVYNARTDPRLPAHPAGDGQTDDLPALNADCTYLRLGHPGTLYLPAGRYRMDNGRGGGLSLYSGVTLRGEGRGRTVLIGTGNGEGRGFLIRFNQARGAGLVDLSLINATPPELPPYNRPFQNCIDTPGPCADITLKDIDWDLGYGKDISLDSVAGLDIEGCDFDARHANHSFLWLKSSSPLTFVGNTIRYQAGRLLVGGCSGIIKGNRLLRTGGIPNPRLVETGGIEFSFAHDLQIVGNQIECLGEPDTIHNDGEALLAQNQFVNTDKPARSGQTQRVVIEGNLLINNPKGIEFYQGAVDCKVTNNTLIDSDGITLRGFDNGRVNDPIVNNVVANNRISNPAGRRISHVTLWAHRLAAPDVPLASANVVKQNAVIPHVPHEGVQPTSQTVVTKTDGVHYVGVQP